MERWDRAGRSGAGNGNGTGRLRSTLARACFSSAPPRPSTSPRRAFDVRHPFDGILSCPVRSTMYVNDLQGECALSSRGILDLKRDAFSSPARPPASAMPLSRGESLQFNGENYSVFIPSKASHYSFAPSRFLVLSAPSSPVYPVHSCPRKLLIRTNVVRSMFPCSGRRESRGFRKSREAFVAKPPADREFPSSHV